MTRACNGLGSRAPWTGDRLAALLAEAQLQADHQKGVVDVPFVVRALADEVRELAGDADRPEHQVGADSGVQAETVRVPAAEQTRVLIVAIELLARAGDE